MNLSIVLDEQTYDLWLGGHTPLKLFSAISHLNISSLSAEDIASLQSDITQVVSTESLYKALDDFESRTAIAQILLQEGEFTPDLTFIPKEWIDDPMYSAKSAVKLAKRLAPIDKALNLIDRILNNFLELNPPSATQDAIAECSAIASDIQLILADTPSIDVTQDAIAEPIREDVIDRDMELVLGNAEAAKVTQEVVERDARSRHLADTIPEFYA